jgi:hypothetical protein
MEEPKMVNWRISLLAAATMVLMIVEPVAAHIPPSQDPDPIPGSPGNPCAFVNIPCNLGWAQDTFWTYANWAIDTALIFAFWPVEVVAHCFLDPFGHQILDACQDIPMAPHEH